MNKTEEDRRKDEIDTLFADISECELRNISHWKPRMGLAIWLYEKGYRIPETNLSKTALRVALEWIKAKSVFSSLNSKYASPELKAKSPKGIFISFDDFNDLYNKEFTK